MLESWRDTATTQAIVAFAEHAEEQIAPEQRIAVFDNDGTLWCEKPLPIQLDWIMRQLATSDEREKQPYKAAHEHDLHWLGQAMVKHYRGDNHDLGLLVEALKETFGGMNVEAYQASAATFFGGARHPTLDRPYTACAFQPMIELLRFLESKGFTTFIASGGDRDFMRAIAQDLYAIPPDRVIGSSYALEYRDGGVLYKGELDVFDDGPEKPVRIWSRIGRRPAFAGGNANGDVPMLTFTQGFSLVVLHDDAEREFDYTAGAETLLEHAGQRGWTVASVSRDWERVFAEPVT